MITLNLFVSLNNILLLVPTKVELATERKIYEEPDGGKYLRSFWSKVVKIDWNVNLYSALSQKLLLCVPL